MPHGLGSADYIAQSTWKNSLVYFDYGRQQDTSYASIALQERAGVLCPFIKSVKDLIGWYPLKCHECPFIYCQFPFQPKWHQTKKKESRWISRDSASCDEIYQLGEFVFQKMKKTPQKLWSLWTFSPFLKIKIIRLATSRPRHFLNHHLQQHFCKNATAHLGQSPFNAN